MVLTKKQTHNSVSKSESLKEISSTSTTTTRRYPARTKSPVRPTRTPRNKSSERISKLNASKSIPLQSSTPKPSPIKARSPIRRSPARKSPTRAAKSADSHIQRRRKLEADSEDSDAAESEFRITEKPKAAVRGRARRLEVQVERVNLVSTESSEVKHSNQKHEHEKVVHLRNLDKVAQKLGEFSDEDDTGRLKKSVFPEGSGDFKALTEFGGTWGVLFLLIFFPALILGIQIICNQKSCSFREYPDYKKYLQLSTFIHLPSLLGYFVFVISIALLSVLPFGGRKIQGIPTKQGRFTYITNGFFIHFIIATVLFILEFQSFPIMEFVTNHVFHLFVASFFVGLSIAIFSYIHSFYVPFSALNAHALNNSKIYQFFMGRELSPRVFTLLDLKFFSLRVALIQLALIDFIVLLDSFGMTKTGLSNVELKSINVNPTLITMVVMRSIYALDSLVYEHAFVTTFEMLHEGFGFMLSIGYFTYAFFMLPVTHYVAYHNVKFPIWQLAALFTLFLTGFILYRASNNQKDKFRKNPYDPAFSDMETVPTTKGKKLLCSGYWGLLRHPNYFGDILMNLAYIPFLVHGPAIILPLFTITVLIHRSFRDHNRCQHKYGAAWERYCNKVKYALIPKVY